MSNLENFNSIFSKRLKQLIYERGFTQNSFANRVGVTRQAVSQYCNGETNPKADKLMKIAIELGVSSDYLLGLSKDKAI